MGSSSWSGTDTYTGYQGFLKNYGETVAPGGEFVSWSSLVGGSSGPPTHFFTLTFADLSNSRATPAYQDTLGNGTQMLLLGPGVTRQEPNGFLNENAATNLVVYSQQVNGSLTGSNWDTTLYDTAGGASITNNTADVLAPDGTQTATKFVQVASTATTFSIARIDNGSAINATYSVWLRTLTGTAAQYLSQGDSAGPGSVLCNITTTWQRFSLSLGSAVRRYDIGFNGNLTDQGSTAACTFYAWGFQLETSPFATSYFPTNTNLMLQSSSVGNTAGAAWSVVGSITAPAVTLNSTDLLAPDGTQTASKIVYPAVTTASGNYSILGQNLLAPSTRSIYLRTLSGTATVYINDGNDTGSSFVTCNVTTTWQRFSMVSAVATQAWFWTGFDTRTSTGQTPGGPGCTVYAWGAQLEAGTQPSSYMAVGAAVTTTRAVDDITFTNPLFDIDPQTWSFGALLTPISSWANTVGITGNIALWFQGGNQMQANSWRSLFTGATSASFDVWDGSQTDLQSPFTSVMGGSTPLSITCTSTYVDGPAPSGVQTIKPGTAAATVGTGTGIVGTQPATITLGFGTNIFNFQGWFKNLFMDRVKKPLGPNIVPVPNGPFDGSFDWQQINVTATAGQSDPDGGTNASLVTDNSNNNQHYFPDSGFSPMVVGATYQVSVYLKAGTYAGNTFVWQGDGHVNIDTTAHTIADGGTGFTSNYVVTAASGGWWKYTYNVVHNMGGQIYFGFGANAPVYAGTGQNFSIYRYTIQRVL